MCVQLTLKTQITAIEGVKPCSLALDAAPLTGKIIKNRLSVFERGDNLLQNGMLHLVIWISQLSKIALQVRIYVNEKPTFLKRAPHFKC